MNVIKYAEAIIVNVITKIFAGIDPSFKNSKYNSESMKHNKKTIANIASK